MAPPKRRKPASPTARLESQAALAWARQHAKIEAADAKAKTGQDEKEDRGREVAARARVPASDRELPWFTI